MSSTVMATRRRSLMLAIAIGGLLTFAMGVPALAVEPPASEPEGCPGTTSLVAEFNYDVGGWTASGSTAGITVTGDSSSAFWTSSSALTAVVISAGGVTENFVYDPPETTGQISSSDVEDAEGGALVSIAFCHGGGSVPNPSSGSRISIDLAKTADCATANPDGTYTVSGTITITRHSPPGDPPQVAIRVKTARDVVLTPQDVALQRATLTTLEGAVLAPGFEAMTQPYSVTFDSMGATALTNKVEIMVEEAVSGLDRHKYYSDRMGFELCASAIPTPTPTPTPTATPTGTPAATPTATPTTPTSTPREGVLAATGRPGGGALPNTAAQPPAATNVTASILIAGVMIVASLLMVAGTNFARVVSRRSRIDRGPRCHWY